MSGDPRAAIAEAEARCKKLALGLKESASPVQRARGAFIESVTLAFYRWLVDMQSSEISPKAAGLAFAQEIGGMAANLAAASTSLDRDAWVDAAMRLAAAHAKQTLRRTPDVTEGASQ